MESVVRLYEVGMLRAEEEELEEDEDDGNESPGDDDDDSSGSSSSLSDLIDQAGADFDCKFSHPTEFNLSMSGNSPLSKTK